MSMVIDYRQRLLEETSTAWRKWPKGYVLKADP